MPSTHNLVARQSVDRLESLGDRMFGVAVTLLAVDPYTPALEAIHGERGLWTALAEGATAVWTSVRLDGAWFPDAFVGPMASLMRFAGESRDLPTPVEDAWRTMAVMEASSESNERGAKPTKP